MVGKSGILCEERPMSSKTIEAVYILVQHTYSHHLWLLEIAYQRDCSEIVDSKKFFSHGFFAPLLKYRK